MQFQRAFRTEQNRKCVFSDSVHPSPSLRTASPPLSVDKGRGDQNTENKVTSWPQGPTTKTAAVIKTEVKGCSIETRYELVMIQIILFASGNSLHAEHNLPQHILEVKGVSTGLQRQASHSQKQ